MEDVLEVYQRPFDPLRPVVCIDEMNRQLVEKTRIPCKVGWPEKVDSEYVRKGVMDVTVKTSPRLEAFLNLKKMRSKASPLLAGCLGIFGIYYFNWLKHPTILIHQTQLQVKQGASLLLLQKQACVFS